MKYTFLLLFVAFSLPVLAQNQPNPMESMWPIYEARLEHNIYPKDGDDQNMGIRKWKESAANLLTPRYFDIKSKNKAKQLLGSLMNQADSVYMNPNVSVTDTNSYTFYFVDGYYVKYWENDRSKNKVNYYAHGVIGFRQREKSSISDELGFNSQKKLKDESRLPTNQNLKKSNNTGVLESKPNDHILSFELNWVIAELDKSIELDSKNADLYYDRGSIKNLLNDTNGAIEDFTVAINIDPNFIKAYYQRGICLFLSQDFSGAKSDLSVALNYDYEHSFKAYFYRGMAKLFLEEYYGAITDLTIYLNNGFADGKDFFSFRGFAHGKDFVFYQRGTCRYATGNYRGAKEDYDKAIQINEGEYSYYYSRGLVEVDLKNYYSGISDYDRARRINYELNVDGRYLYHRGMALSKSNNFNESCKVFAKSCSLGIEKSCSMERQDCAKANK